MFKKVTVTTALISAGLMGSLGFSAIAQTRPMSPATVTQNQQISALDRQFVMDAAQGGMAEVRMAELALQRASSQEVKRFARDMIREHTRVNEQLMRLATRNGVTPPTTVGPKYEAAMNELMKLSGTSFDTAYMNEAGINGHLEATAVYQRQAAFGKDPELKAFATRILPSVQGHLEMAGQMTGYRFAQNNRPMPGMRPNQ